jgi:DNA mismatch repair protein MutS
MRCGDFYEMFHEDAKTVSRELQIVLTSRNKNTDSPIPMAGVPHHAYEDYAAKLIELGYKVAICEQVEDPKTAKGIVKREVTQVITPGTVTLSGVLNPRRNNYLGALHYSSQNIHFVYVDVTTGQGLHTFFPMNAGGLESLREEVVRINPAELLIHSKLLDEPRFQDRPLRTLLESQIRIQRFEKRIPSKTPLFFETFSNRILNASGISRSSPSRFAWEMLLAYTDECTVRTDFAGITSYSVQKKLQLDPQSIRNLELQRTLYSGGKENSLLEVIDRTVTASGSRLLSQFLIAPLIEKEQIEERLDTVESFMNAPQSLTRVRDLLKGTYDLFRLINRLRNRQANGRDLLAIRNSLRIIPEVRETLKDLDIADPSHEVDDLQTLCKKIELTIAENPPAKITEGNLIREGVHTELDYFKDLQKTADSTLRKMEEREKEKTGAKSLKIRFNRVFGYYYEVPKSQAPLLSQDFQRRQTLSNAERFTNAELKEMEKDILHSKEAVERIEYGIFQELREEVLQEVSSIQKWAGFLSFLDVMGSFAYLAVDGGYSRPEFLDCSELNVMNGRHPVVEKLSQEFVPNDLCLHSEQSLVQIITGPNMGGKSTFLRQTALLVIMAQMGSFVPADRYRGRIFDRIFTRVGASDDLGGGKSTFMVEMSETAYLLKYATDSSLVLLDEVGRGTATFDGLSIAWSVLEHIAREIGCMTLFATHYHELTQMSQLDNRVRNYSVSVLEAGNEVLFLHKIEKGAADKSYGIHVAKLAGMPAPVIRRARELLEELQAAKSTVVGLDTNEKKLCVRGRQRSLPIRRDSNTEDSSRILDRLHQIEPEAMSPMEALQTLMELKQSLR